MSCSLLYIVLWARVVLVTQMAFFIRRKITKNSKMKTGLISVMLCGELRREYLLSQNCISIALVGGFKQWYKIIFFKNHFETGFQYIDCISKVVLNFEIVLFLSAEILDMQLSFKLSLSLPLPFFLPSFFSFLPSLFLVPKYTQHPVYHLTHL